MEAVIPAFSENNVAVLLTSSDLYAPYVGVVIESILENATDKNNYDILIFQTDISEKNQELLLRIGAERENFSVRIIDITDAMQPYEFQTVNKAHKKYNFYRLTALEVLTAYDKIIYLDSDLVVCTDLAELYGIELGDRYLAATKCIRMAAHCQRKTPLGGMELPMRDYLIQEVGIQDPDQYFNSGVMLLGLDNMRTGLTSQQLLEFSTTKKFATVEQDVLNLLCEGRVLFLPLEWNYLCPKGNGMEQMAGEELYAEWVSAKENAKIWHFVGGGSAIPCNCPTIDGAELFWRYGLNSPFEMILLERLDTNAKLHIKEGPKKVTKSPAVDTTLSQEGPLTRKNAVKELVKRFFPYGSDRYIALKKIYFKFKHKGYNPTIDILERKALYRPNGKIKIYVSRRIDLNSQVVNNPIFQDVRCGACYDQNPSAFLGDDTGDNISQLRIPFCEMTVLYWAWKNEDADYYGLCHYRRYPSFVSGVGQVDTRGWISESCLDKKAIKRHRLDDFQLLQKVIPQSDIWVAGIMDVTKLDFLEDRVRAWPGGKITNIFELFMLVNTNHLPSFPLVVLKLIEEIRPQYYPAATRYMKTTKYYAYNCFVMKKSIFHKFCDFAFPILFELDKRYNFSLSERNHKRTPGYMSEFLYGIFVFWAIEQGYDVKETPLIFFHETRILKKPTLTNRIQLAIHKFHKKISNSYRILTRMEAAQVNFRQRLQVLEQKIHLIYSGINSQENVDALTSGVKLNISCLANQIHEYHKAAFSEFKNCHRGQTVVIVASGPTMKYYCPIKGGAHIGMNASFINPTVKLDYYFATDFEGHPEWSEQLKNYDFIKFFGQYSSGNFCNTFQASEKIIEENHGRRFFQGAPSQNIHYDIEYYPLAGFYTIALQALHFALYTNPKAIYLVGCDCNLTGYFDGTAQKTASNNIDFWMIGYKKMKEFAAHFYPETEIISINPVGLKGLFRDVYTENYLDDHPEIDRSRCEVLTITEEEITV